MGRGCRITRGQLDRMPAEISITERNGRKRLNDGKRRGSLTFWNRKRLRRIRYFLVERAGRRIPLKDYFRMLKIGDVRAAQAAGPSRRINIRSTFSDDLLLAGNLEGRRTY